MREKPDSNKKNNTLDSKEGITISPSAVLGVYLITGFIVATIQVTIWRWELLSLFSPNFYWIVITWPLYISGLIGTILNWIWVYIIEGIF